MEGFMNTLSKKKPRLRHDYLEKLFSHKSDVDRIFKDVLGLYDIDHIAITHINEKQELLTFSSAASLEFNLFKNTLWQFDKTYHPDWYQQCEEAVWESLYLPEKYHELYYLKQIKPQYIYGVSLATHVDNAYVIYSFASQKTSNDSTFALNTQEQILRRVGTYCYNKLQLLIF